MLYFISPFKVSEVLYRTHISPPAIRTNRLPNRREHGTSTRRSNAGSPTRSEVVVSTYRVPRCSFRPTTSTWTPIVESRVGQFKCRPSSSGKPRPSKPTNVIATPLPTKTSRWTSLLRLPRRDNAKNPSKMMSMIKGNI